MGERGAGRGACNGNLHKARKDKNDEFYTKMSDVEDELRHYKGHFAGRSVLCNCDDPEWSSFWRYFVLNFEHLGLRRLVSTHYQAGVPSYSLAYDGLKNTDGAPIFIRTPLTGDGDFRSPECVEMLNDADVVVTNPPFSLFREYVALMLSKGKRFVVVGNHNAITYKDIFSRLKDGGLWLGMTHPKEFGTPEGGMRKFGNICWYTNLEIRRRREDLPLFRSYAPAMHPIYDNYDGINIDRTQDIPVDWDGPMGVPITFLNKHNPSQFEILGSFNNGIQAQELGARKTEIRLKGKPQMWNGPTVGGSPVYFRIVIRRKQQGELK